MGAPKACCGVEEEADGGVEAETGGSGATEAAVHGDLFRWVPVDQAVWWVSVCWGIALRDGCAAWAVVVVCSGSWRLYMQSFVNSFYR